MTRFTITSKFSGSAVSVIGLAAVVNLKEQAEMYQGPVSNQPVGYTRLQPLYGEYPVEVACPYCQTRVISSTTLEDGNLTYTASTLCCLVGQVFTARRLFGLILISLPLNPGILLTSQLWTLALITVYHDSCGAYVLFLSQ